MNADGRLRVLQVGKFYSPYPGGMETHLKGLCGELQQCVDVQIVVANEGRYRIEERIDGIPVTRLGTWFNLASTPVCPGLVGKIRNARAELVHIHYPHPTAILAYLASGHKGLLVVTYHSDIIRQKVLGPIFLPVLHRALARSAALIVASDNYVETSPVLSAYRKLCHVIPHGIDTEQFEGHDGMEAAGIRARYGPRIVISVGRLVYYKGFEYLIRAMSMVNGRLLIVGDGPLHKDLEREAQARGVGERVVFLGKVPDVVPYYQAGDVFVLASIARSEAFGIVQLEAMACGKPVVNTRLDSGVPFVSIDGVTGMTVPPKDPEALAQAINLLLDDPARRTEYGEAGRRRVQREFTVEVMAQRTLQLYREVRSSSVV